MCLPLFPCVPVRLIKSFVNLHILLELSANILSSLQTSDRKPHDVSILDEFMLEADAFYIADRVCLDFERVARFFQTATLFVTRVKRGMRVNRLE